MLSSALLYRGLSSRDNILVSGVPIPCLEQESKVRNYCS